MKISKLFHWLYGAVMLLPLFAIGITCGYAMFNKNAKDSYYGENINQKQYIETYNIDDLEVSKNYTIFNETYLTYQSTGRIDLNVNSVVNNSTEYRDISQTNRIALYSNVYNNVNHIYIVFYNGDTQITNYDFLTTRVNITFNLETFSYRDDVDYYLPLIYRIDYNKESFLSDVFYYSVDRVTQSSYFNWAYDSFLVAPFSYIVALFSMPSNSPIVMFMSYWLAISIIWLVFDLVMYVPLLVHRWLDKGGIE